MIDSIRKLIAAQRLYPAERRSLADALETIAATQRRLADADERVGHVVRRVAEETAPKKATGRPKGSGGAFVRCRYPPMVAAAICASHRSSGETLVRRRGSMYNASAKDSGFGHAVNPTGTK